MPKDLAVPLRTTLLTKLHALNKIVQILGLSNHGDTYNVPLILKFATVLKQKGLNPIMASACAGALDVLLPGWRSAAPKSIIGKIVSRNDSEVFAWRSNCLLRDKNQCVSCYSKQNLHVHHICSWAEFPELRVEESNGETLCGDCHSVKHPKMGIGMFVSDVKNNTN